MTLSLANHHSSLPVAYRLYLPKEWAEDEDRRSKAGVPDDIDFETRPEIALQQVRGACEVGLPRGVVLMDAGYGASTELRASIAELDLPYVAGILPNASVWAGEEPLPPRSGLVGGDRRNCCVEAASRNRSRSRTSRSICHQRLGAKSPGVEELQLRCPPALHVFAFVPPIANTGSAKCGQKSGC